MKNKILMLITAAILFLMLEPVGVFAESGDRVPDLTDESKSLTVYFFIENNGEDTPIEGATVSLHKIADLSVSGGSARYLTLDKYADLKKTEDGTDITFEGISASDSNILSKDFAKLTGEPEQIAVTDKKGKCTFEHLEKGMYLVQEIRSEGDAERYEKFEPYMVSVPLAENFTGDYEWVYDVLSEPKTVVKRFEQSEPSESSEPSKTSEPSELSEPSESSEVSKPSEPIESSQPSLPSQPDDDPPVTTGDLTNWAIILGAVVFSAVALALLFTKRKNVVQDDADE